MARPRGFLAKLEVTSRDEAVMAWQRQNRRPLLRRLPAFAALGIAGAAVLAVMGVLLLFGGTEAAGGGEEADDLRVLVADG